MFVRKLNEKNENHKNKNWGLGLVLVNSDQNSILIWLISGWEVFQGSDMFQIYPPVNLTNLYKPVVILD